MPADATTPPIEPPKGKDLLALCSGNESAAAFLMRWHTYCHAVDDLVDEGYSAERFLAVLAQAIDLYSHPFWLANAELLKMPAMLITNAYANSVLWEQDPADWRFKLADVLRFAGVLMTDAVVLRCGGYGHLRTVSPTLWQYAWQRQHDEQGQPH